MDLEIHQTIFKLCLYELRRYSLVFYVPYRNCLRQELTLAMEELCAS